MKIKWKNIFRLFIIGFIITFFGKRIYHYSEIKSIKQINKIYYSGNYEKAKEQLILHLDDYPNSSKAWSFLGNIYLELNDTINAKLNFQKGLKLDNENYRALTGLGVLERMKGNYIKAKEYYENSIKIYSNNPDAYSGLLVIEIVKGDYNKAVELGEKARELNKSKKLGILGNLAIAYHYNKQFEQRDEILKELEKENYKDLEYINMVIEGVVDIRSLF